MHPQSEPLARESSRASQDRQGWTRSWKDLSLHNPPQQQRCHGQCCSYHVQVKLPTSGPWAGKPHTRLREGAGTGGQGIPSLHHAGNHPRHRKGTETGPPWRGKSHLSLVQGSLKLLLPKRFPHWRASLSSEHTRFL